MTRLRAGAALLALLSMSAGADVAVFRHATVYPVGGAVIDDGALHIEDGSIVRVGRSAEISSPAGAREVDLSGKVVIPGLVDSHSHLGGPSGGDGSDPLSPDARSLDAIDVMSKSFWRARGGCHHDQRHAWFRASDERADDISVDPQGSAPHRGLAAELLGIDDVVGSLERGKHGDLVLFDGDPFEYTSHVCGVVVEGELVSDACW